MTAYTLLASSASSPTNHYHQKCHPTIEMLILPRRRAHLIKLLIFIPLTLLLLSSIYYTFYYELPNRKVTVESINFESNNQETIQARKLNLINRLDSSVSRQDNYAQVASLLSNKSKQSNKLIYDDNGNQIDDSDLSNNILISNQHSARNNQLNGDNDDNDDSGDDADGNVVGSSLLSADSIVNNFARVKNPANEESKYHQIVNELPRDRYYRRREKARFNQQNEYPSAMPSFRNQNRIVVETNDGEHLLSVSTSNENQLLSNAATTATTEANNNNNKKLLVNNIRINANVKQNNNNNQNDDNDKQAAAIKAAAVIEEQADAQSVAVIPPPNEANGPGEMGRPVVLKNLTKDQQDLVKVGWENNAFDQYISDMISLNRSLPDVRDPSCKNVQYSPQSIDSLPPTSIIICFHNEAWSVLLRTVHSALNRSPNGLIKEIILVDDFSTKAHLKQQLEDYVRPFKIVKIVRATKREGLIRARLLGAKHATAPVLTFLDSHCECAHGWLEPLLARIKEDSHAVVCPVIDVISDKTFEYHYKNDADSISVGGFDWNLQFNWHNVPEHEKKRRKHPYDPIRSPTMAGGLFSIDKKFFERLGTYDSGFDIWGGENLELSFKTWMCGGTLEIIPCSHVGHVFRSRSPYKWRTGVNVLKKNSVRLAEVWMDEYKQYYYDRIGRDLGDYGDISERLELRKQLKCKPFSYFVKEIYPELFIPGEAVAYGEIRNEAGDKIKMCLDSPARKSEFHKPLGVYPCHGSGGNQYWLLSKDGEIRRDEACVDYAGHDVVLFPCHGSGGNQLWYYDNDTMLIKHSTSGRCLELTADRIRVQMSDCDSSLDVQRWKFEHYNSTLASRPEF